MQVSSMKYEAQFDGPLGKRAQQRDRIGAAGEADCQTHPRVEQRCVQRERGL